MAALAALMVAALFLTWYFTWFGRPLSDEQIEQYLRDDEKPRHIQHALLQIAHRIEKGDQSVKRWYGAVASLANHSLPEVRMMAAWTMGQDNSCQEFHNALLLMLSDIHPTVRHNAALALVRFGDPAARPELVSMLKPIIIKADSSGTVSMLPRDEGATIRAGSPIARIKSSDGKIRELSAPEAGHLHRWSVSEGSQVAPGDEIARLWPETEQVWEALRALYLIGQLEDIPHIEPYTQPIPGLPERIRKQATMTMSAIRARAD
jgi:hypothetical protein